MPKDDPEGYLSEYLKRRDAISGKKEDKKKKELKKEAKAAKEHGRTSDSPFKRRTRAISGMGRLRD